MSEPPSDPWMAGAGSQRSPQAGPSEEGVFEDRSHAGRRLGALLAPWQEQRPVVLGIARGGVPVAVEVARALGAPLDVTVVRKIGAPQNPEFAIGAVAEGEVHVCSGAAVRALRLSDVALEALVCAAERELEQRLGRVRGPREPLDVSGRTAIIVDDGVATGRSAQAAVRSLRRRGAARVVLATPVASSAAALMLRKEANAVVCVAVAEDLWAVGYWYEDFSPVSDEEVTALLAQRTLESRPDAPPAGGRG